MLIVEIATGVILGLLLYRGFDSFCERRNLTLPAGIFALGVGAFFIALPVAALVLLGPLVYKYVKKRDNARRLTLTNDLPPDPPGYFWVRTDHRPSGEDQNDPLLRGGHCERDCDSNRPLWLVPNSK